MQKNFKLAAIYEKGLFLATKGSRVLEEKVNEAQAAETAFNHLNKRFTLQ